ncbi:class II glutamine amidotransferase [Psittacicella gerlachiana]|uniref:class II glutamine amidotransferase n=1 Tax=Psittacicella gerlachiana TaxID=2028574 RepID=UPI001FE53F2D|nr:class II glutamine amidotransferase [Psittacicella gerlachiana]
MCQILALNANAPTDIIFSFEGFVNRAGITETNVDGTGIAFFEEHNNVRLLKDDKAAYRSYVRNLVRIYQIKSKNIIAHIRRASSGAPKLVNCHPFVRELWSENWVFCHNGHLESFPNLSEEDKLNVIGETDSELFFTHLVSYLRKKFTDKPDINTLFLAVSEFVDTYANSGILNFVVSNGTFLIAHCSTNLYWISRSAQDEGLIRRLDDGGVINLSCYANKNDKVTIICTMPVTDERWHKMSNGQTLLFEDGDLKLSYYGTPSIINKKYEALTGLSSQVKQKIEQEQAKYRTEDAIKAQNALNE